MDVRTIQENVREMAQGFASDRSERQRRRELDRSDFDRLAQAGFLLTGVPVAQGGIWEDTRRSTRPICEILRTLAHGDPSVALLCSMHPAVLSFWLTTPEAPPPFDQTWSQQRQVATQTAADGAWWGTITSEPGSGGDVAKSTAKARLSADDGTYHLTGQKHFGSGSGNASLMITAAVPTGETEPDWFYLDVRDVPWDGSTGMRLVAPWDGHGMAATQSHGFAFEDFPATRFAWPGSLRTTSAAAGGFVASCFAAVIVGVVETALETARTQLARRHASFRAYEQVEWSRVEVEGWLIAQAFDGMLRAVEENAGTPRAVIQGKIAISELTETVLTRLCKIMGGGSYSRYSPFGYWFEDVRALGYLRPPWALAFDRLHEMSWPESE